MLPLICIFVDHMYTYIVSKAFDEIDWPEGKQNTYIRALVKWEYD